MNRTKLALSLILVLGLTTPTFAVNTAVGNGNTPLIVFRNHAARTLEVDYAPASSFTDVNDDVYDFRPQNGDNDASHYLNSNGNVTYNVPAPPTPPPTCDVNSWETAIWNDTTIDVSSKMQGIIFYPLIEKNAPSNPTYVMQAWGALVAANAAGQAVWLTTDYQTKLLKYAAQYLVPLTPQTAQGIDPNAPTGGPTSESAPRRRPVAQKIQGSKAAWQDSIGKTKPLSELDSFNVLKVKSKNKTFGG